MTDPHAETQLLTAGPKPEDAAATLILLHGRGASADDILALYPHLAVPTFAAVAPQAANHTWYPNSFLFPLEANQPYLDSALARVESIVADLLARGIPSNRIALLGFSQGACLTSEYIARHPRPYAAALILTGGLIGPPNTPRDYPGTLASTPVLLSCGDPDPHIPFSRVLETETVLTRMGGKVRTDRYPGRPHTIYPEEIDVCRTILSSVA